MGAVLAVCLAMVLGASFFAYKNLYYAGVVLNNLYKIQASKGSREKNLFS